MTTSCRVCGSPVEVDIDDFLEAEEGEGYFCDNCGEQAIDFFSDQILRLN